MAGTAAEAARDDGPGGLPPVTGPPVPGPAVPPPPSEIRIDRGPVWSALIRLLSTRPLTFEEERRRLLFGSVAGVGGVMLVVFGVYHLVTGPRVEGVVNIAMAGILTACVLILRRTDDGRWLYRAAIVLFGCLFVFFGTLGDHGHRALWALTYPAFALFVAGRRIGGALSLLLLVAWVLIFTVAGPWIGAVSYPDGFAYRFVAAYLTILSLAFFTEQVVRKYSEAQERHRLRLREVNRELAASEARMRDMALADALTGIQNRRGIHAYAEQLAERSRRGDGELSVALLDIDRFKSINDRFGHAAGDHVLRECVARVQACLRPYDQVGRWGGEEFLLVFHDADPVRVGAVVERVRRAVSARPVVYQDRAIDVTVSVGVAGSRGQDVALEALVGAADEALYRAKRGGRDRVEVAARA